MNPNDDDSGIYKGRDVQNTQSEGCDLGADATEPEWQVMVWRSLTFGQEEVEVDGVHFADCTFEGTTITYSGGEMPTFQNCHFTGVQFRFSGPAMRTISTVKAFTSAGLISGI